MDRYSCRSPNYMYSPHASLNAIPINQTVTHVAANVCGAIAYGIIYRVFSRFYIFRKPFTGIH